MTDRAEGETEWFGDVAHRTSVVDFYLDDPERLAGQAVISLQLVRVRDDWLVHAMAWHSASDDLPVPQRFLEP